MAPKVFHVALATWTSIGVTAASVTPIRKVLEMMEDMKAKGIQEKEAEATRFSSFSQWCQDKSRTVADEINLGTQRIETLAAKIAEDEARIASLTGRIDELEEDISRWARDKTSSTDVRNKEAADYRATAQDYSESMSALDQAIAVLKNQPTKIAQAQALLQVQGLRMVSFSAKQALKVFLAQPAVEEMPNEMLFRDNVEAHGYESSSGGVIDMLARLKDEFGSKKNELDKEELASQHAFEDIAQQLTDNTENAKHEVEKKTLERSDTQQNKASREGEKTQAESDLAEDQKYLDEAKALCSQKASDFEARQKLRGDEIEAVSQAIEIMSSDSVAGAGEKHLPSFVAMQALVQLRSSVQFPAQSRAAAFLTERAKTTGSRVLAEMAQHVAADPFGKVRKMIGNLIKRLMEEATQETEHKGWCDTELATNQQTRDIKTEAVGKLTATKEDLTVLIAQLSQDIEDLTGGIQQLDQAMQQAAEERAASKAKNAETVADAKAAQAAVEQAMAVLKDFYAKAAQATALVQGAQSPAADAPETFDKPYQGLGGEGGNVVSFLEVILSDFARLESETSTSDLTEQDTFEKFTDESQKDRALKDTERSHKTDKRSDSEQALAQADVELKLTQEQLDTAVAYYEKLRPTCVDTGMTYEERVRQREEEIQSLTEALQILEGTDLS